MGPVRKNRGKIVYNYDVNRRRVNKQNKKLPTIRNKEIKKAWEAKSISKNFDDMGLVANPNKSLPIKKPKEILTPSMTDGQPTASQNKANKKRPKSYVVEGLEAEANTPQLKTFSLPESELAYVKYMMDKYGEDYKAMAKDLKNHYQDTPKQLKRKIQKYKVSKSKFKNKLEGKTAELSGS